MPQVFIRVVPQDPFFVPSDAAEDRARDVLHDALGDSVTTESERWPCAEFLGDEDLQATCPECGKQLDQEWFAGALAFAVFGIRPGEKEFVERDQPLLETNLPCCQLSCSLNNLSFDPPACFTSFCIEIHGLPRDTQLPAEVATNVEQALGCQIRQISCCFEDQPVCPNCGSWMYDDEARQCLQCRLGLPPAERQ